VAWLVGGDAQVSAQAQPAAQIGAQVVHHDVARADALFEEAKGRLQAGDWLRACEAFQQSFDLDPSVSTLVKIGRCREHEGRWASALTEYRRAFDLNRTLAQSPGRAAELDTVVREAIAALAVRVPRFRLVIVPKPPTFALSLDGTDISPGLLDAPLPVDPGEHEIVMRAAGYREERIRVTAVEGTTRDVRVTTAQDAPTNRVVALDAPAPGSPLTPSPPTTATPITPIAPPMHADVSANSAATASPTAAGSSPRVVGWGLLGAGGATLAAAAFFGVRTLTLAADSQKYCNADKRCTSDGLDLLDQARGAQTTGLVLAGVGAAIAGTGIVVLATAPAHTVSGQTLARLVASPDRFGASLEGSF
jgi:hypothetical protein